MHGTLKPLVDTPPAGTPDPAELPRLLRLAVEQSEEGVIVTDLDARILWVNPAVCAMTGYADHELVGANPRLLKSGHTPRAVYEAMWRQLTRGRSWRGYLFNRRKDGSDYVEHAVIRPVFDEAGRPTHYMALKRDVTEQRRLREELKRFRTQLDALVAQRTAELERARADAEAASRAKSAFLATMSHEIRTPMNGVIGVVDLLQRSSLTPYQRELADTIAQSGALLLALIDDILDFSKIEAGRLELQPAPFDLLALVESTADALQPLAAARNVVLHVFVDPALPARRVGDALRLRQIVTNLLGNAIKFSARRERSGRVALRVRPAPGGALRLSVADDGVGMSPQVLARLFQPFEQGEAGRARGGSGLGLAICDRLVRAMGGRIEVHSAPDAGSRFDVTLPLPAVGDPLPPPFDLRGLAVELQGTDPERMADWAAWLAAAGARPDASQRVRVVEADTLPRGELPPAAAPSVVLERGRRRQPRLEAPGHVRLDADALHRDALLHAVALAAGRVGPPPDADPEAAPAAQPTPDLAAAAATGRVVLVAEDNEVNQLVIAQQLQQLGFACEVVADGAQALARWRAAPARYGLLLTDLHMPALDGFALTAALRAEEAARARPRLPVLALTANALAGERARCEAAGMDAYLVKPVRLAQLEAALRRWLPALPSSTPGRT